MLLHDSRNDSCSEHLISLLVPLCLQRSKDSLWNHFQTLQIPVLIKSCHLWQVEDSAGKRWQFLSSFHCLRPFLLMLLSYETNVWTHGWRQRDTMRFPAEEVSSNTSGMWPGKPENVIQLNPSHRSLDSFHQLISGSVSCEPYLDDGNHRSNKKGEKVFTGGLL